MKSEKKAPWHLAILLNGKVTIGAVAGIAVVTSLFATCAGTMDRNGSGNGNGAASDTAGTVYQAELKALNTAITPTEVRGKATIRVKKDTMFITIAASGLEPGIMHQAYYFGFPGGQDASCATMRHDANKDGSIDIVEIRTVSGVALIPFNDNPAELDLTAQSYPTADAQGTIAYRATVMLSKLQSALKEKYGIDSLRLEQGVVYLHGVSPDANLPQSVQSLPGAPAHATLPVACGELEKKGSSWLPF